MSEEDSGRALREPALALRVEPPSSGSLAPAGFDPARITALLEAGDENCLQPIVRKAADEFYDRVLGTVQDYLMDNLDFNLKSHLSMLERENQRMRTELWEVDQALGQPVIEGRLPTLQRLETTARRYHELLFAVSRKHEGEDRHATALRYIRERDSDQSGEAGQTPKASGPEGRERGPCEATASPN